METITDKVQKFRSILKELEEVGNMKTDLLIKRELAEAGMIDAEDKARAYALAENMPVTRMTHYIKAESAPSRSVYRYAHSMYKRAGEKYELLRELLNGVKFDIRCVELLANNTNL